MRRAYGAATAVVIASLTAFGPIIAPAMGQESNARYIRVADEPQYQGKSLSYWLRVIGNRDDKMISVAFEAVRSMGPQAWPAVPELTRIVSAPFSPIRIGKDSDATIAAKLYDIEIRSEAIDVLASIGESAAPATAAIIQWAVTVRVVPEPILTRDEDERFIDLVTLDAEYRIRIIGAVAEFGRPAVPALNRLLKSSDTEKRKLAVAILGEDALTAATELMKSNSCDDKQLAVRILGDMEPFVSRVYLAEITSMVRCDAN
jgi:hypothetical protein